MRKLLTTILILCLFASLGMAQHKSGAHKNTTLATLLIGAAQGDIIYWDGAAWVKLNIGSNGQFLTTNGTIPNWGAGAGAADSSWTSARIDTLTAGNNAASVTGRYIIEVSDGDLMEVTGNTADAMLFKDASGGYFFDGDVDITDNLDVTGIISQAGGSAANRPYMQFTNSTASIFTPTGASSETINLDIQHATTGIDGEIRMGDTGTANEFTTVDSVGQIVTPQGVNFAADSQGDDDYEINLPTITALTAGLTVTFTANTANTDGATLEITSVGDLDAIVIADGASVATALATGEILAGQVVTVVFDGTNWQVTSRLANDRN